MNCPICKQTCIKKGMQKNGSQKYYCKFCDRYQQLIYQRKAYNPITNDAISKLVKNGCGTSAIKRILEISATTVAKRIKEIASKIVAPPIPIGKEYEMDEMRTYIGNKDNLYWIAYAIEKKTRKRVSFYVGKRTNKTLKMVIDTLLLSKAKTIYTDAYKNYRYIIPKELHKVGKYGTVHIERKNLDVRTDLKRLQRKTICYSRSLLMLNV